MQEGRHADDAIDRCSDFMTHTSQKLRFQSGGFEGGLFTNSGFLLSFACSFFLYLEHPLFGDVAGETPGVGKISVALADAAVDEHVTNQAFLVK